MKRYVFVLILLFISSVVFSNDSRTVLGSSVEVIDNENTNIVMQEEEINITLYNDYYEVDVTFCFYNEGISEDILLGFPVRTVIMDYPSDKEWAKLHDFKTYINGILLPEYTIKEESIKENFYITTTKWFLRKVTFPAKSHTISRITYKAPYNNFSFFYNAGYIYGTGRSWKGPIGKMTVNINHGDEILIDYLSFRKGDQVKFIWEGNGKYKYVMENFKPEIDSRIFIEIKPFDIYGKYGNEFGDWAEGWIWDEYLLYKNFSDIRLFTKNQIRLFINFFYALHGYNFNNIKYKDYFHKMDDFMDKHDTKYIINPNFSINDFNEIERKNILYLVNLEKRIP